MPNAADMNSVLQILICAAVLALVTTSIRDHVWNRAPFYTRIGVLIYGCAIGATFASVIHFALQWIGYSHLVLALLGFFGFISLVAIGHRADRVDWKNNALNVSKVAAASYASVLLPIYVL
jgi:hypothetical protein